MPGTNRSAKNDFHRNHRLNGTAIHIVRADKDK